MPEPLLVAAERDVPPVRRPCEGPLSGAPRRVAVLCILLQQRARASAVTVGAPEVEPPVGVAQKRELRAVGREPGLLDGHTVGARHRDRIAAAVDRAGDDAALVPRHVGDIPLVPRDVRGIRRPHGIEAEVGPGREPYRPWAAGIDRRARRRGARRSCTQLVSRRGRTRELRPGPCSTSRRGKPPWAAMR